MIKNYKDLEFYLRKYAKYYLPIKLKDCLFIPPKYLIHKHIIYLRCSEYHLNISLSKFH